MNLFRLTPADAFSAEAPIVPDADGFVHLCEAGQVDGVRARFFDGVALVIQTIDSTRLDGDALRWEDTYGHGAYPHYYGTIPADAVIDTEER